jgi:hypothetical protein
MLCTEVFGPGSYELAVQDALSLKQLVDEGARTIWM